MTVVIIIAVLVCVALVGYVVYASYGVDGPPTEPPPTVEELLQARLDLYKVNRGFDLSLAKHEARREGERTKEAIADALDDQR